MKISMHSLALAITLLASAQGAVVGISGADVLSTDESLGICPPDMDGSINTVLGMATDGLNTVWQLYASEHNSLEDVLTVPYTVETFLPPLQPLCMTSWSRWGSFEKLVLEVSVTKVTGLSSLQIDDLTIESSTTGRGESCSGDPNSGPFRCVYEGIIDGGISLSSPLEVEVEMKGTVHCKGSQSEWTTEIDAGAVSCDLSEDVLVLGGNYCAGQCLNFPYHPVLSNVAFDGNSVDISSLDCSTDNKVFDLVLDSVIAHIKGIVTTTINEQIAEAVNEAIDGAEAVNEAIDGAFPLPTGCW